MSRLYLCGITYGGQEANLRALVEPVAEYFHGLQFGFSLPADAGSEYLETRKGDGRIVYYHWAQRHGFHMTEVLYQGTMEEGDYFLFLDTLERCSPEFCRERLPNLIKLMDETNTAMIANYGKGLLFRYNEQMEFRGSPHWYATGLDGQAINMELPKDEFWSVRSEQRDEYQWVRHYAKYFTYPAGSNHAALGLDHHPGDPNKVFPEREARRLAFRKEIRRRGFPLTVEGVLAAFRASQPLDPFLKDQVNTEKVWNDLYRYEILGDKTVVHSHSPSDMKVIP